MDNFAEHSRQCRSKGKRDNDMEINVATLRENLSESLKGDERKGVVLA